MTKNDTPSSTRGPAGGPAQAPPRAIIARTRGSGGAINRLVSPSDLGELIKPFVFLDLFEFDGVHGPPLDTGWHPHSGIATVTVMLEGAGRYAETTGNEGILPAGAVEWMRAGGGVWHTGGAVPGRVRGFQLWVALPEHLECAPSESRYVNADDVPEAGPVRVVLGDYGDLRSPIDSPPMTYLVVTLKAGERWTYQPPSGHDVAWVAISEGALTASARIAGGEVAVFEPAETPIDFVAEGDTQFVLGSAVRHPYPLALGNYSVHTSRAALERGEAEIRRIGVELRRSGKKSYALARL